MTITTARQPQGIPAGGQFAAITHPEAAVALDAPLTYRQALDTSTLVPGQPRVIGQELHGIHGIDTVTLTDKGPLQKPTVPLFIEPSAAPVPGEKRLLEMRYTLPADANIAELYEFDDWSYRGARHAAQSGLEEFAGLGPTPWPKPASLIPDTAVDLDEDGNASFTVYETFRPGEAIDPDDFASWASEYSGLADPGTRQRLAGLIQDSYNS